MRRWLLIIFFLLLAFYVGWPMWSAWRIHTALDANDAAALAGKVDFPAVRASLRPSVIEAVDRSIDKAAGGVAGQILGGALKQKVTPQVADTVLAAIVTPERVSEIYTRRGDIRDIVRDITARRQARKAGEAQSGGDDEPPVIPAPPKEKPGLRNIKRLAYTSLRSIEIGLARDKDATEPDLIAQIGFVGFDWKLIGLIPRARRQQEKGA